MEVITSEKGLIYLCDTVFTSFMEKPIRTAGALFMLTHGPAFIIVKAECEGSALTIIKREFNPDLELPAVKELLNEAITESQQDIEHALRQMAIRNNYDAMNADGMFV